MENIKQMLEHMSNMGIAVIAKDTHTVFYTNAVFRRAYQEAVSGAQADTLLERDEGGKQILRLLKECEGGRKPEGRHALYLAEFGGNTDVCIDTFDWEGVPSYVLYFTVNASDGAQQDESEISGVIMSAVSVVYPFVAVINVSNNAYMVLTAEEGYLLHQGDHGIFSEVMPSFSRLVHPEDQEEFVMRVDVGYLLAVFQSGQQEVHLEFRMKQSDGEYHWMAVRFVRVQTADQSSVSCVGLMRNIDYRMDLQQKLQTTLDAAYAAIPGGVIQFVADENMSIVYVNEQFCSLVEKTPEDYYEGGYGRHVLPEDWEQVRSTIYEKAANREPFDVTYRTWMGRSDRVRWMQLSGVPIDEREGNPVYLGIRMDVTELKNAQINLMAERARADLAIGTTDNIRFEYDRKADMLTLHDPDFEDKGQMKTIRMERFCERIAEWKAIYPDDRDNVLSILAGGNREAVEIRIRYPQKSDYRWCRIKGKDVVDPDGHAYIVGIIANIAKEKSLENANEQMSFMLQDSFQRMYIIDTQADTCQVIRLGVEHTRKRPLIRKLTRIVSAYERSRIYPADLDNFHAKYLYLSSPSAFTKGRSEVYFDVRIRDGLGPDYHWYTILIRRAQKDKGKLICLAKCVDEMKRQENLQRKYAEQMRYQKFSERVIDSLGALVEFRDSDSGEHILRTKQLTKILLIYLSKHDAEYELTEDKIEKITMAAAMHDVGKISIPDVILNKPGKLTPEEYEIMKTHTTKGYDILTAIEIGPDDEFGCYCREICRYHHERYDGKGYPDHLIGDDIPIWGQIVSIVDVYDALVSQRVYKPAYPHERAVQMIMNGECGSFNPKLLSCLEACADELRACYE